MNGAHFNKHLQNSYNKYGSDNFEFSIVETCTDLNDLCRLEQKYIQEYRNKCGCYNILAGGETMFGENNPFYGRKHTLESIVKMVEHSVGKHSGPKNNFYGKDHSGENNGFYGHKHTEESRKKMSISKSGMYKGSNNPFYGKTHTHEVVERIRMRTMQAKHSEVICVETGEYYRSMAEAGRQTGVSSKRISDVCAGRLKTAGNLHWKYYNGSSKQDDTG